MVCVPVELLRAVEWKRGDNLQIAAEGRVIQASIARGIDGDELYLWTQGSMDAEGHSSVRYANGSSRQRWLPAEEFLLSIHVDLTRASGDETDGGDEGG